jgi:hypothetical protein
MTPPGRAVAMLTPHAAMDPLERALSYPYAAPAHSYLLRGGEAVPAAIGARDREGCGTLYDYARLDGLALESEAATASIMPMPIRSAAAASIAADRRRRLESRRGSGRLVPARTQRSWWSR